MIGVKVSGCQRYHAATVGGRSRLTNPWKWHDGVCWKQRSELSVRWFWFDRWSETVRS